MVCLSLLFSPFLCTVVDGHVKRLQDEDIQSNVLEITGSNVQQAYITCPADPNATLGIKLPFLVMIVKNVKKYFTFEIQVLDDKNVRRRFRASNYQVLELLVLRIQLRVMALRHYLYQEQWMVSGCGHIFVDHLLLKTKYDIWKPGNDEICSGYNRGKGVTRVKPYICAMPLRLDEGWNQIQLNLSDLTRRAYGTNYVETLRVQVHANCRLRRIYFSERLYSEEELPPEFKLYLPMQVNLMDWFSRADDGYLVVPRGFDGFSPSSDSWSKWDSTPFGNFKSGMKRNNMRSYVGAEDCEVTGNGLSSDVDMEKFGIDEEPFDNAASQASYCNMDQWSSYPPEQLEFHLDNLASIDQLDDVFLSSLLADGPTGMDAADETSDLSTDSPHSMLMDDDQAGNEDSNSEHMTTNSCAGTAKYFSAHAFTSPVDWRSREVNNPYLLEKAPQPEIAVKLEHDKGDSRVSDKEISMEESILQHLENLTSQLTEQTRICFRDSLYRLADNSKQDACQSRNAMTDQDSTWFSKEEATESQTNVIDRTVANLLFSNVEFGVSEGSSLDFAESSNIRQHSDNMLWNNISGSSGGDAPTLMG
ncbi:Cilia- and flagella-associated protein 20 [Capsicum baccatum]|uniref:Cilia-and flagella-associated protein 20 n=1 Tax=Capsicum baccatum TaxID=33114 RepID=A0A2G2W6Y6_CAPBA|nr:Cilia- and flagella-associated protein 20 [Capsicum baccatum]